MNMGEIELDALLYDMFPAPIGAVSTNIFSTAVGRRRRRRRRRWRRRRREGEGEALEEEEESSSCCSRAYQCSEHSKPPGSAVSTPKCSNHSKPSANQTPVTARQLRNRVLGLAC
jgi:hypothetical protein